jgi:hypothetical protein
MFADAAKHSWAHVGTIKDSTLHNGEPISGLSDYNVLANKLQTLNPVFQLMQVEADRFMKPKNVKVLEVQLYNSSFWRISICSNNGMTALLL